MKTTERHRKSYEELMRLNNYDDRLSYLRMYGKVGADTFGFNRYLNQTFYRSKEWKNIRRQILLRDGACDLGIKGRDIFDIRSIVVHHINPLTIDDFINNSDMLLDPNNLITTSLYTHNLIHYGDSEQIPVTLNRLPNDTCPWKI